MRYRVEWQEEAQVRTRNTGWVEADSEEEAIQKLKDGDVNVDDSAIWDELDSSIMCIDDIYEDPK